ncbi:MAG: hypothetical protein KK478_10055 [Ensifer alkalisoli]|nr:hypothetical protein [Sinorhizobium alkalisoli]
MVWGLTVSGSHTALLVLGAFVLVGLAIARAGRGDPLAMVLGIATGLLGLMVTVPPLGHGTWQSYGAIR